MYVKRSDSKPGNDPGKKGNSGPLAEGASTQSASLEKGAFKRLEELRCPTTYYAKCTTSFSAYHITSPAVIVQRLDTLEGMFDREMVRFIFTELANNQSIETLKYQNKFDAFVGVLSRLVALGCTEKTLSYFITHLDCVYQFSGEPDSIYSAPRFYKSQVPVISTKLLLERIDVLEKRFGEDWTRISLDHIANENKIRNLIGDHNFKVFMEFIHFNVRLSNCKNNPLYGLVSDIRFSDEVDVAIIEQYDTSENKEGIEANIHFLAAMLHFSSGDALEIVGQEIYKKPSILESHEDVERTCMRAHHLYAGLSSMGFTGDKAIEIIDGLGDDAATHIVKQNLDDLLNLANGWQSIRRKELRASIYGNPNVLKTPDDVLELLVRVEKIDVERQAVEGKADLPRAVKKIDAALEILQANKGGLAKGATPVERTLSSCGFSLVSCSGEGHKKVEWKGIPVRDSSGQQVEVRSHGDNISLGDQVVDLISFLNLERERLLSADE